MCRTRCGKRSCHNERIKRITRDTPNFHSMTRVSLKKNHGDDLEEKSLTLAKLTKVVQINTIVIFLIFFLNEYYCDNLMV